MQSPRETLASQSLAARMQQEQNSATAAALVAELERLPCVSGVSTKPTKPANRPNNFGVSYKLKAPGSITMPKRSAVTGVDGERPTFISAVQHAIQTARQFMLEEGIAESDATPADQAHPATYEELEWLNEWMDEQQQPEMVTLAELTDALTQRRSAINSAQAGTSSARSGSDESSAFTALHEMQLKQAQLASAQRRLQRAKRSLERIEAALPDAKRTQVKEHAASGVVPDHPRVASGGSNPLHWKRYWNYSQTTYQKLETEEQDRRSIPINRDLLEHDLPRGDETEAGESRGWFSHWRRGIGPALRGWAKGSLGAVVHMLAVSAQRFGVVDELGAELGFLPLSKACRHPLCHAPCIDPTMCPRTRTSVASSVSVVEY